MTISTLILLAGFGQLSLLIVAALLPARLNWRHDLAALPPLHRQMHWAYGGYVVLSFVAFGLISIANASTLAGGSPLARAVCSYIAIFWGIRLLLQRVFEVRTFLTRWWLKAGYALLTIMFAAFTAIYGWAAIHSVALS